MAELVVPRWGLTMEDAVVVRWLKREGAAVASGEAVVEIETDKATGEVESPVAGRIARIVAPEGATVQPGEVLAEIEADGDGGGSA